MHQYRLADLLVLGAQEDHWVLRVLMHLVDLLVLCHLLVLEVQVGLPFLCLPLGQGILVFQIQVIQAFLANLVVLVVLYALGHLAVLAIHRHLVSQFQVVLVVLVYPPSLVTLLDQVVQVVQGVLVYLVVLANQVLQACLPLAVLYAQEVLRAQVGLSDLVAQADRFLYLL